MPTSMHMHDGVVASLMHRCPAFRISEVLRSAVRLSAVDRNDGKRKAGLGIRRYKHGPTLLPFTEVFIHPGSRGTALVPPLSPHL